MDNGDRLLKVNTGGGFLEVNLNVTSWSKSLWVALGAPVGAMQQAAICAFGANIRGCCFVLNNQLFDEEMLCKCFDKCSKALAINTG